MPTVIICMFTDQIYTPRCKKCVCLSFAIYFPEFLFLISFISPHFCAGNHVFCSICLHGPLPGILLRPMRRRKYFFELIFYNILWSLSRTNAKPALCFCHATQQQFPIKERKKEASISMLPFSYLCLMVSMSQIHAPAVYGNTPAICHITARHPRRTPPSLTEQYHKSYAHHLFVSK